MMNFNSNKFHGLEWVSLEGFMSTTVCQSVRHQDRYFDKAALGIIFLLLGIKLNDKTKNQR